MNETPELTTKRGNKRVKIEMILEVVSCFCRLDTKPNSNSKLIGLIIICKTKRLLV